MMTNLFLGRDAFVDFSISVTGIVLVIPALLWLFFKKHNSASQSTSNHFYSTAIPLSWLSLIVIGILIAPVSSLIIKKLIGSVSLSETFITIPTALIVVYTFIYLTHDLNLKGKRCVGATICLLLLIAVSSSIPIRYAYRLGITPISNAMKIDSEVCQICEIIGDQKVLLPKEILGQVGEFDSKTNAIPMNSITYNETLAATVAYTATKYDNAMVVINKVYENTRAFDSYNYKKIAETNHYVIYQRFLE